MLRGTVGGLVVMNGGRCLMVAEFYGQPLGESSPAVESPGPGSGLQGMSQEVLGASLENLVGEVEARIREFLSQEPLGELVLKLDEIGSDRAIAQVKEIRDRTGLSLKEAKSLLDQFLRPMQAVSFPPVASKDLMLRLIPSSERVEALREALKAIREEGRAEGVKQGREEVRRDLEGMRREHLERVDALVADKEYYRERVNSLEEQLDERYNEQARARSVLNMVLGGLKALDLGAVERVALGPIVGLLEGELGKE